MGYRGMDAQYETPKQLIERTVGTPEAREMFKEEARIESVYQSEFQPLDATKLEEKRKQNQLAKAAIPSMEGAFVANLERLKAEGQALSEQKALIEGMNPTNPEYAQKLSEYNRRVSAHNKEGQALSEQRSAIESMDPSSPSYAQKLDEYNQRVGMFNKEGQAISQQKASMDGLDPSNPSYAQNLAEYNKRVAMFSREQRAIELEAAVVSDAAKKAMLDEFLVNKRDYEIKSKKGNMPAAMGYSSLDMIGRSLAGGLDIVGKVVPTDQQILEFFGMAEEGSGEKSMQTWRKYLDDVETAPTRLTGIDRFVTPEYIERKKQDSLFSEGLLTIAEMAPALATGIFGGTPAMGATFFTSSYRDLDSEMQGEYWEQVSDAEKEAIKIGTAFVSAGLSTMGMQALAGKIPIVNDIFFRAAKQFTGNMSAGQVRRIIDAETKSYVANLLSRTSQGIVVEGIEEVLDYSQEEAVKHLYEEYKRSEFGEKADTLFQNAETMNELADGAWKSFVLGGMAGGMIGGSMAAVSSIGARKRLNDKEFDAFKKLLDSKALRSDIEPIMAAQVEAGEMSQSDFDKFSQDLDFAEKAMSLIPEGMSIKATREAFDLLLEKQRLSSKDKNLVKAKIAAIDEKLAAMASSPEVKTKAEKATKEPAKEPALKAAGSGKQIFGSEPDKNADALVWSSLSKGSVLTDSSDANSHWVVVDDTTSKKSGNRLMSLAIVEMEADGTWTAGPPSIIVAIGPDGSVRTDTSPRYSYTDAGGNRRVAIMQPSTASIPFEKITQEDSDTGEVFTPKWAKDMSKPKPLGAKEVPKGTPDTPAPTMEWEGEAVEAEILKPDTQFLASNTRDSDIGRTVTYQGVEGVLAKNDDGYFVVTPEEDIIIEGGLSDATNEELGLTARMTQPEVELDLTEVEVDDVGVDPNAVLTDFGDGWIVYRGSEYSFVRTNLDNKGNEVSVTVLDANGNEKTIRNKQAVEEIVLQKLLYEDWINNQPKPDEIAKAATELGIEERAPVPVKADKGRPRKVQPARPDKAPKASAPQVAPKAAQEAPTTMEAEVAGGTASEKTADIPDTVRGRKQVRKGFADLRESRGRQKELEKEGKPVDSEKFLFERIDIATRILETVSRSEGAITPDEQAEVDAVMQEAKDAGYEVIDLKGKRWTDDIKGEAEFFFDETLEPLPDGEPQRIIDRVRKPLILKDGKMVRAPKVVVRLGPTQEQLDALRAKQKPTPQVAPEVAQEAPTTVEAEVAQEPTAAEAQEEAVAEEGPKPKDQSYRQYVKETIDRADDASVEEIGVDGVAVRYIASGGRLDKNDIMRQTGMKEGDLAKKRWLWMKGKGGKANFTIDQLAHSMWENGPEQFTTEDYRNAIIDALLSLDSKDAAIDRLREMLPKTEEEMMAEYQRQYDPSVLRVAELNGVDQRAIQDNYDTAENAFDNMTDAEKQVLFDELEQLNNEEAEQEASVKGKDGDRTTRVQDVQEAEAKSKAEDEWDAEYKHLSKAADDAQKEFQKVVEDFNRKGQDLFPSKEDEGMFGDTRQFDQDAYDKAISEAKTKYDKAKKARNDFRDTFDKWTERRAKEMLSQMRVDNPVGAEESAENDQADPRTRTERMPLSEAASMVTKQETEEILKGSVIEGRLDTYAKRVAANLKYMGTPGYEWKAVPFTGERVQDKSGKSMLPQDFSVLTGGDYKSAPTLFPNGNAMDNVNCEWCGKGNIKEVFTIFNEDKKWTLSVGNECVGHFAEGVTGKEMGMKAAMAASISKWKALAEAQSEFLKVFRLVDDIGYGRTQYSWTSPEYYKLHEEAKKLTGKLDPEESGMAAFTKWEKAKGEDAEALTIKLNELLASKESWRNRIRIQQRILSAVERDIRDLERAGVSEETARMKDERARAKKSADKIAAYKAQIETPAPTPKAPEGEKKTPPKKPTSPKEPPPQEAKPISEKAKAIADKLRQGKLGGKGLKSTVPGFEQAWDTAIEAAALTIEASGTAAQAIANAMKAFIDSDWYRAATQEERQKREVEVSDYVSDIAAELEAEKPKKPKDKEDGEPKQVKKTFTTVRAYEGEFREGVKKELEKTGLYRVVEKQAEAKEAADAFIEKVGLEAALAAVDAGDVTGAARTFIRGAMLEDIDRRILQAENQETIQALYVLQADLMQQMSAAYTSGGQEAAALNFLYQNTDLGFNSTKKAEEWEKEFGEKPSEEQMAEWRKRDEELKEVRKQLDEAIKRAEEAEAAAAIEAIKRTVNKEKQKPRTYTRKAKDLAEQFRKLKAAPMTFRDANGNIIEVKEMGGGWNEIVEIGAKAIEKTGQLLDGIAAIAEYMKGQPWFSALDDKSKKAVMQQIEDRFRSMNEEDTDGRIRIPKSMIREAVEAGANDINTLVAVIKEQIKEDYPDATDREIRDAITDYGKVVNMSQDEISAKIRRMRDIGRTISAIEDVEAKKRPLRSGLQRDKLDAEQRALKKKLRELMKELPLDTETQQRELKTTLDAAKTRTQNRIEDLQREIEMRERVRKTNKILTPDQELQDLIARKEALQKEHDAIFKDKAMTQEERLEAAVNSARRSLEEVQRKIRERELDPKKPTPVTPSAELLGLREQLENARAEYKRLQEEEGIILRNRLATAKAMTKNRIADLQRRLDEKDFAPRKRKDPVEDTELVALKAKQMRLREQYDKEFYRNRLANRTLGERIGDSAWQAWGITRALQATGEFSFILIQGGALTISNMWHNPGAVVRAFKNTASAFASETKSEVWLMRVKAQDWYPKAKKAKLAITEPHAELSAREELFFSDWTRTIWSALGSPLLLKSVRAHNRWVTANPFRAVERAAVAYLDTLRIERYLDGVKMMEAKGEAPTDKDLKDIADVANTLTGRASLGRAEFISDGLTKIFFSPRLWASSIKTATPYGFYHFGKMTPTARKMAMQDMARFVSTTMGFVAMAALYLDNDDDEETGVEMDPRSTDFMKIKVGDTRIDPWGGRIQQVVFTTKLVLGSISLFLDEPLKAHKNKQGELYPLGVDYKSPSMKDVALQMATNKLAPSASLIFKASDTKLRTDKSTGNQVRLTPYGEEFNLSDEAFKKLIPIYWESVAELLEEDPGALEGFLLLYAFLGGGVQVQKPTEKRKFQKASTGSVPGGLDGLGGGLEGLP